MTTTKEVPGLVNLKDVSKVDMHSRVLVIGDSGTGKTRFLSTMEKPYVADFDYGLESVVGMDVVGETFTGAQGWVLLKKEVDLWRKEGPRYGRSTFCVDSLSTAADAAMEYVLQKNNRQVPTQADWGEAIREVKELLSKLSRMPCDVAVTAHLMVERDELTGAIKYLPLIYGKELPGRVAVFFSDVFATDVVTKLEQGTTKSEYRIQVCPDTRIKIVKSRMNRTGKFGVYEAPNYKALIAKAYGSN